MGAKCNNTETSLSKSEGPGKTQSLSDTLSSSVVLSDTLWC